MSRQCQLTGKKNNTANSVSHSNRRTKRVQKANVLSKRIFVPSERRWIRLKVSTSALRTMEKVGVEALLKEAGVIGRKVG